MKTRAATSQLLTGLDARNAMQMENSQKNSSPTKLEGMAGARGDDAAFTRTLATTAAQGNRAALPSVLVVNLTTGQGCRHSAVSDREALFLVRDYQAGKTSEYALVHDERADVPTQRETAIAAAAKLLAAGCARSAPIDLVRLLMDAIAHERARNTRLTRRSDS